MNADEETPPVLYFDGRVPVGREAVLTVGTARITVRGPDIDQTYARDSVQVSPRIGRAARFIALPGGGQLQCPDVGVLDDLPQEVWSEGIVAWLEAHRIISASSVAIFVLSLILAYVYGLPVVAQRVADGIPREAARPLGETALDYLDSAGFLDRTTLREEDRRRIEGGFAGMHAGLEVSPFATLEFRSGSGLGANALALPGGIVVVTDELVERSHTDDEVLAVLAHELGHAELRQPMASLLQGTGLAIVLSAVTGDVSGIAVAGPLAISLLESNYSREAETVADEFAFDRLRATGRSPRAFATFLQRVDATEHLGGGGVFESHPATQERVQRAYEEAADEPMGPPPIVLRTEHDLPDDMRRELDYRGFLQFSESVVTLVSARAIGESAGYLLTDKRVVAWPPEADSPRAVIDYADIVEVGEPESTAEEGTLRLVTRDGNTTDLQVPRRLGWYERVRDELLARSPRITASALVEQASEAAVAGDSKRAGETLEHALSRLVGEFAIGPDLAEQAAAERIIELWLEHPADRDVVPVLRTNPEYPESAQTWGTEGWVHLRFRVDEDGRTREIVVVDADPEETFDEAATRAVEAYRYVPRIKDGNAVDRAGVEIVLRFDIDD